MYGGARVITAGAVGGSEIGEDEESAMRVPVLVRWQLRQPAQARNSRIIERAEN